MGVAESWARNWIGIAVLIWAMSPAAADIVRENALPGVPAAEWDVEGAGDPSIQGFATDISFNRGETAHFKFRTDAREVAVGIYRVGYYGGDGARRVAAFTVPGPHDQSECVREEQTGLIDCGNWKVSAAWRIPPDARSGVYFARIERTDTGGASHILFVVRDDESASDILVQTSDTTWQAYNSFGGNSLYVGEPDGRAYKVSYNRPMILRGTRYARALFWANEYPMIRWLEANGYDVTYSTGVDTARRGELLKNHKVFMSLGHDEYWSAGQRANVAAAVASGVHLAFFSGNAVYWKTRWEPSLDASGTPYRTMVCYKETHAGRKLDPTGAATGTWRDPRFGLPPDGGWPENALKGSMFVANCCRFDSIMVSAEQGRHRFWRHTPLAALEPGTSREVGRSVVGYEWDGDVDNGFRPRGLMRLSATTLDLTNALLDFGSNYGVRRVTHNITLFRHQSGALVFAAGTIVWGWALDPVHDDPDEQNAPVDPVLQQATVNLLADMSVFPASAHPSLVVSEPPEDRMPPAATIVSPQSGHHATFHLPVEISGTAMDSGGVPAGIEVSTDDGASWHPADGLSTWSYRFTPRERGAVTVLARAVDDSGNLQPVPASIVVQVVGYSKIARALAPVVVILFLMSVAVAFGLWRRRRRRIASSL